jgi:methionyl-tRNA formyltransferase
MSLRIVFMGTPDFAVASLEKLIETKHEIVGVVTVPDKPAGRGQKLQYSAVKQFTLDKKIPILQPEKLKDVEFVEKLKKLDADLFVVVAFRMLPEVVWSLPRFGTINLHASLLPQYRGAAPINWAIINGETETGITTFYIEKDIDTGNIIFNDKVPIGIKDSAGDLHDKLMVTGANLIIKTVDSIESGKIETISQKLIIDSTKKLNAAPKLDKETCKIIWNDNSLNIYNKIRGLSPYPAAWSILQFNDNRISVKIFESEYLTENSNNLPGTLITDGKKILEVATADGLISIKSLQIEGKKRMLVEEFLRGFHEIGKYQFVEN